MHDMWTKTAPLHADRSTNPAGHLACCAHGRGANTGIGKTLASIGLADAARRLQLPLLYLKPVQTGFPEDSDARLVALAYRSPDIAGPHAAFLLQESTPIIGTRPAAGMAMRAHNQEASCIKVMHAWSRPVSPHLAVHHDGRPVSDRQIVASLSSEIASFSQRIAAGTPLRRAGLPSALALVETAGGVASPAPSGELQVSLTSPYPLSLLIKPSPYPHPLSLLIPLLNLLRLSDLATSQCDVMRPLRLPCVLIGDPRLGGISSTISAYESLTLRGFDVDVVVVMDAEGAVGGGLGIGCLGMNSAAIQRHMAKAVHRLGMRTQVVSLPPCPPPTESSRWEANRPEVEPTFPALDVVFIDVRGSCPFRWDAQVPAGPLAASLAA